MAIESFAVLKLDEHRVALGCVEEAEGELCEYSAGSKMREAGCVETWSVRVQHCGLPSYNEAWCDWAGGMRARKRFKLNSPRGSR